MYVKQCPYCGRKSYCSCQKTYLLKKRWLCPYCQKDLTKVEVKRAKN